MCLAHFNRFYICYSRLADILDSKVSKKYAKVGIFCMYPDSRPSCNRSFKRGRGTVLVCPGGMWHLVSIA